MKILKRQSIKTILTFAAMLILFCVAPTVSAQKIQSQYTDLIGKKCKTIEEDTALYIADCPGITGYKLKVNDFDLRMSVTVIAPGGSEHRIDFDTAAFHSIGNKAEWRVKKEKDKIVPIALIIRFNVQSNPENPNDETSYLLVAKITVKEICVVDKIKFTADANVKARESADKVSSKSCLKQD